MEFLVREASLTLFLMEQCSFQERQVLDLLNDEVAEAFPSAEAVNEALLGLLPLTEQTVRIKPRATRTSRKRAPA